ncbi:MAG: hypothetical protein IT385_09255 [Deltaproteobacteria bacterium]|nr:hypothetical protein [Deltaproteobacteria bacterium]
MIDPRLALSALALNACISSRYQPTGSPFISVVMDDSAQKFHANGRVYDSLADAMAHDAEALALLKQGESDFLLGAMLSLGGSALVGLGTTEVLFASFDESMFGASSPVIGIALLGVGIAGTIGGLSYVGTGERDRLDAMNMFNDRELQRWLARRDAERAAPAPEPPAPSAP